MENKTTTKIALFVFLSGLGLFGVSIVDSTKSVVFGIEKITKTQNLETGESVITKEITDKIELGKEFQQFKAKYQKYMAELFFITKNTDEKLTKQQLQQIFEDNKKSFPINDQVTLDVIKEMYLKKMEFDGIPGFNGLSVLQVKEKFLDSDSFDPRSEELTSLAGFIKLFERLGKSKFPPATEKSAIEALNIEPMRKRPQITPPK